MLDEKTSRSEYIAKYRFIVLVTLTWHNYGDAYEDIVYRDFGIPRELVSLVTRARGIFFRLRLHPVQKRDRLAAVLEGLRRLFDGAPNVDFESFNDCYVGAALAGCHGHITVGSAAAIEGRQLGVKTLFVEGFPPLSPAAIADYFDGYIDGEMMVQVSREALRAFEEADLAKFFASNSGRTESASSVVPSNSRALRDVINKGRERC